MKTLLDSGTMGMFMDKRMVARHGFKLQKLERPIMVRNVDGTNNSRCKGDWAQVSRRILSCITNCS